MFLDESLSAIGRATEVQLNTLRRKLGVGCDPCFDYSVQQLAETVREEEVEESLSHDEQFLQLLKRVNSVTAEETRNKILVEDAPHISGNVLRKKDPEKRPSSAFKSCSRAEVQKRDAKSNQGPPVGSYSPKTDCLASYGKVKHPTPKVPDFRAYMPSPESSQSLQRAPGIPSPDETKSSDDSFGPECRKRRQITFVNMSKQIPRPDLLTVPPNDPQALDPQGVLDGHLKCARFGRFYRQPCFEFRKLPREEAASAAGSESNLGEYDVKLSIIKPTAICHSFSNIPRPEFAGSTRITDHLPDRSLARDCRSLTRFGRLLSPPVSVPAFDRPAKPVRPLSACKLCSTASHKQSLQLNSSEASPSPGSPQWAWPSRKAPRTLGISVSHGSYSEGRCRPQSAPLKRVC